MMFVGLDVIGEYVTEINVTSPTGIRELNKKHGVDIGGMLVEAIHRSLSAALMNWVCAESRSEPMSIPTIIATDPIAGTWIILRSILSGKRRNNSTPRFSFIPGT